MKHHLHRSLQRFRSRSRAKLLYTVAMALVATTTGVALSGAPPAGAYAGAPWFRPDRPYTGNFPDPNILVEDGRYYAYATATGGSYLPVMTSTDLATWVPRPAYDPGAPLNTDRNFNDALPRPARWSPDRPIDGRMKKEVWAPGVAKIGGRYVAFYSARERLDRDRFCISVAVSTDPLGPFEDTSSGPLVCDPDPNGSIDPQPFVDTDGTPYLLWKSEGVPGWAPTRIWVRQLDAGGTGFAPGSRVTLLLETDQEWEGHVIENPAMVRHDGRVVLFYSANEHRSADYAVGYAECVGVLGPCTKNPDNPVLASRGDRLGPGGPAPFVDASGRLMLGFHYWNAPYTNYPAFPQCQQQGTCTTQGQRRLAIEQVFRNGAGLHVGTVAPSSVGADQVVAIAATRSGSGYWIAGAAGTLVPRGDASDMGGAAGLNFPVVGMASGPAADGYWMVASDGGVFSFGHAAFNGSTGAIRLNQPIVAMAPTPSGNGYWLVASDGGIFSFGDAAFHGSTGDILLNEPVVGMAPTASGSGYWLVAADGGIFTFGDAAFEGSMGAVSLNRPVVGMTKSATGGGYRMVASDGGIFSFGDAQFHGSTGHLRLHQPIVGMASTPSGGGYWMVAGDGGLFTFGDAGFHGAG